MTWIIYRENSTVFERKSFSAYLRWEKFFNNDEQDVKEEDVINEFLEDLRALPDFRHAWRLERAYSYWSPSCKLWIRREFTFKEVIDLDIRRTKRTGLDRGDIVDSENLLYHIADLALPHYNNHLLKRVISGGAETDGIDYHIKLGFYYAAMVIVNAKIHDNNQLLCVGNYELRLFCLYVLGAFQTVSTNIPAQI